MSAAAGAAEADAEEEVTAPVIFQCKKCKSVVGDSFAWVASTQELNAITLQLATSSVSVKDTLETSTNEADLGSTSVPVMCRCKAKLGRVYRTTARALDHLRDMITFDVGTINSYQLGSGSTTAAASDAAFEELMDLPTAESLQSDVVKLQNMVLVLNERIEELESAAAQSRSGDKRSRR